VAISLYKHPNTRKGRYCAICLDRTQGAAQLVRLPYGVEVHLCAAHASQDFQTMRMGRDFTLTLHRAWSAAGCMTRRRSRALDAHSAALRGRPAEGRRRPGSYAWPSLRLEAEQRAAAGEAVATIIRDLRRRHAHDVARAPSARTIHRWIHERRWVRRKPPRPVQRAPRRSRRVDLAVSSQSATPGCAHRARRRRRWDARRRLPEGRVARTQPGSVVRGGRSTPAISAVCRCTRPRTRVKPAA
jgi:hypothetical protein